ncbi:MAG: nickel pincer cofactor biosynthesis protein LarC [Gaiellales bacterium]
MSRVAYLDCIGGLAGDMLLAALLDAGAPEEELQQVPGRLGIGPVEIRVSRVERHGIGASHVDVVPPAQPPHRTWRELRATIDGADLTAAVRERSLETLAALARAESAVHGVPIDDVHFHELGGIDTLVDVCGAAVLIDALGIEQIVCSPLPLARGFVEAAHGALPLPPPATVELLRGAQVRGVSGREELVTPTGAALAVTLASSFGEIPALTLERVGYGAGTSDFTDRPNLVRVLLGEAVVAPASGAVVLLETNLDDLNPELVPDAVERCFTAGALDVWVTPVQMKKGRPGVILAALARPADESAVARAILEETSALGVRISRLGRYELDREERNVAVDGGSVRVKVGLLDGRVVNVAPEHDDCAALASLTGRPVKAVWAEALAAAQRAG